MKIVLCGHSHIHLRQHLFGQELARQGHEVLQICPQQWGKLEAKSTDLDYKGQLVKGWRLKALPHTGDNIYSFSFRHMEFLKALWDFKPDWIYTQQEPGSLLASLTPAYAREVNAKCALFTWENMSLKGGTDALKEYDLVVCGNDTAQQLVSSYAKRTILAPQVGIQMDLFIPMPEVEKTIGVGFVGRNVPEKGIPQLLEAWPQAHQMAWESDYRKIPRVLNQARIIVAFSQDSNPDWREQAAPYIAWEANACEVPVIVSDSGSIPFWYMHYNGTNNGCCMVDRNDIAKLRTVIKNNLSSHGLWEWHSLTGRRWVQENLSNQAVAKKLLEAFNAS